MSEVANIKKLIELVLKDAENKEQNAVYSGDRSDGGASVLKQQVKFYKYGLENTIPPEWKEYEKQLDSEYNEYLRLKGKFEK